MGNLYCIDLDKAKKKAAPKKAPPKKAPPKKAAPKKASPKKAVPKKAVDKTKTTTEKIKTKKKKEICNLLGKETKLNGEYLVNPHTNRKIKRDGPTAEKIFKGCNLFPKKKTKKFLKEQAEVFKQKVVNPISAYKIGIQKGTFKKFMK